MRTPKRPPWWVLALGAPLLLPFTPLICAAWTLTWVLDEIDDR